MYRSLVKGLLIILTLLANTPITTNALEKPVSVKPQKLSDTYVLTVSNPSNRLVNISFYDTSTGLANETYESNASAFVYTFDNPGTWKVEVRVDGTVQDTFYFGLGSIVDTGFKTTMMQAFGGNLYLIAIAVLVGVSIFAITIGRYAGVPLVIITLGILSQLNYVPSWLIYVIMLVMAFAFATGLYILIGGRQ